MRCPSCKESARDKVIDSRLTEGGQAVRRRRECTACGRRYTTKERVEEETRLSVVKKDGSRMPFDPERILNGVRHACYKRPIPLEALHKLVQDVEDDILRAYEREVPSRTIGALVSRKLRDLDHVAYVRFASIYREFKDLNEMIEEIELVKDAAAESAPGQQALFE